MVKVRSAIDLFAGPGGWDLAAETLGVRPLGIEYDDAACLTREAAGLWTLKGDVAALDPQEVMRQHFRRRLDLLIGSPPCQAWSTAGKQQGELDRAAVYELLGQIAEGGGTEPQTWHDDRSPLATEPLRWALALRPTFLAWEQVPPVLELWEECAIYLRREGWEVWTGLITAEQYGVAQTRERAVLTASQGGPVRRPPPTHRRYVSRRKADRERDAQAGLFDAPPEPIIAAGDHHLKPWVSMAEAFGWGMTERPSVAVVAGSNRQGGHDPLDGGSGSRQTVRSAREADEWIFRNGDMSNAAVRRADEPAPTIKIGDEYGRRWVRDIGSTHGGSSPEGGRERDATEPAPTVTSRSDQLEWVHERPAPTIVAQRRAKGGVLVGRQLPDGEGQNIGGTNWEDGEAQETADAEGQGVRVTLDEAATIQSFPPGYPFQGSRSKQGEQIGNAFPPLAAKAVLGELLGAA